MEFYLFLIIAFLAEIVGTFTGFGTTTILVPLASFFMSLPDAIVLAGLFHLFGTLFRVVFFRKGVDIKITLLFGIPALIFSGIGASFLANINVNILSKILGVLLIFYACLSLFKQKVNVSKKGLSLILGGSLVGFLAGFIGTAGALRGAFLTSWGLSKEIYLGTGAAMGLGADLTRVLVYFKDGLLKFDLFKTLSLLITALVATYIGFRVVNLANQKLFTKIVLVALILAGIKFLI